VDFDRNCAARTVVIDDQSDWFEIDGNAWLDESERSELKKQVKVRPETQSCICADPKPSISLSICPHLVCIASAIFSHTAVLAFFLFNN